MKLFSFLSSFLLSSTSSSSHRFYPFPNTHTHTFTHVHTRTHTHIYTQTHTGKVKRCNCPEPYLCRHNKTASYNTRRPAKEVLKYKYLSLLSPFLLSFLIPHSSLSLNLFTLPLPPPPSPFSNLLFFPTLLTLLCTLYSLQAKRGKIA